MNRNGEVLSYKRVSTDAGIPISDVQVDFGGGNTVTARHYSLPGDDAFPLVGETAICVLIGSEWVALGFRDPKLEPIAQEGERVLTSRSALGTVEAQVHLKADGTTEINGSDFVALARLVAEQFDRVGQDFDALKTAISAGLNGIGSGPTASGSAGAGAFESAAGSIPSTPGDTASQRLKTE